MDVASNTATTEPLRNIAASDVNAVADAVAALVSGLVPADVPLSWTSGIWSAFDRIERLAAGAKVLVADRLAESKVWERAGFASAAEFMAQRGGTTVSSARDTLKASRRLADLPTTQDRLRDGALSPSQAHQITDAATHNPAAEHDLLAMAEDGSSFSELRDACGRAKAAADEDPEGRRDRLRAARKLRQRRETDGAWSLWAQGTVTDAAVFNAAIGEIIDGLLQDARESGEPLTYEQAAYDAFVEMANRIITTDWNDNDADDVRSNDEPVRGPIRSEDEPDSDTVPTNGQGDPPTTTDAAPLTKSDRGDKSADDMSGDASTDTRMSATPRKKRPRRKAQPYLGIVRADLAALRRGFQLDGEVVEIAGIGPISVEEAREILGGDAVLQLVLTNGVAANVTNFRRSPNTAQRMALLAQMPCCSVKGCPRTWTQTDHRHDWAKTYVTVLDDLDPLCWWHHAQKTHHGWALVEGTGKRAFVPPTDPRHPNNTATTGVNDTPRPDVPRSESRHRAKTRTAPPPNKSRPAATGRGGPASMAGARRQRTNNQPRRETRATHT